MDCLTIDNTVLKTQQSELTTHSSQSRGSVAKWFKIDGKLVCKWFPAESKENIS